MSRERDEDRERLVARQRTEPGNAQRDARERTSQRRDGVGLGPLREGRGDDQPRRVLARNHGRHDMIRDGQLDVDEIEDANEPVEERTERMHRLWLHAILRARALLAEADASKLASKARADARGIPDGMLAETVGHHVRAQHRAGHRLGITRVGRTPSVERSTTCRFEIAGNGTKLADDERLLRAAGARERLVELAQEGRVEVARVTDVEKRRQDGRRRFVLALSGERARERKARRGTEGVETKGLFEVLDRLVESVEAELELGESHEPLDAERHARVSRARHGAADDARRGLCATARRLSNASEHRRIRSEGRGLDERALGTPLVSELATDTSEIEQRGESLGGARLGDDDSREELGPLLRFELTPRHLQREERTQRAQLVRVVLEHGAQLTLRVRGATEHASEDAGTTDARDDPLAPLRSASDDVGERAERLVPGSLADVELGEQEERRHVLGRDLARALERLDREHRIAKMRLRDLGELCGHRHDGLRRARGEETAPERASEVCPRASLRLQLSEPRGHEHGIGVGLERPLEQLRGGDGVAFRHGEVGGVAEERSARRVRVNDVGERACSDHRGATITHLGSGLGEKDRRVGARRIDLERLSCGLRGLARRPLLLLETRELDPENDALGIVRGAFEPAARRLDREIDRARIRTGARARAAHEVVQDDGVARPEGEQAIPGREVASLGERPRDERCERHQRPCREGCVRHLGRERQRIRELRSRARGAREPFGDPKRREVTSPGAEQRLHRSAVGRSPAVERAHGREERRDEVPLFGGKRRARTETDQALLDEAMSLVDDSGGDLAGEHGAAREHVETHGLVVAAWRPFGDLRGTKKVRRARVRVGSVGREALEPASQCLVVAGRLERSDDRGADRGIVGRELASLLERGERAFRIHEALREHGGLCDRESDLRVLPRLHVPSIRERSRDELPAPRRSVEPRAQLAGTHRERDVRALGHGLSERERAFGIDLAERLGRAQANLGLGLLALDDLGLREEPARELSSVPRASRGRDEPRDRAAPAWVDGEDVFVGL